MRRQSNYWDKRSQQRYSNCEKMTDEYLRKNTKMLNRAKRNIQQEIINVYKNYYKNGIFNKQDLLEKLPKHQSDEILKKYSEKDFPRFLNNNYKSRINRLQEIQCQIYDEIKKLGIDQQNEYRSLFSEVIDYSYNKNIYDTQKVLNTSFEFTKIDENMINNLLETKWYGNNYSSRIWANNNIFANQVGEIIGGALISGQGVEKTTRQVRERFGVHDYYARRLAQTETNYFHNQADAMAYKEMGVDRYVYVATLDLRTSEVCREMDGEIIKYSDMKVGDNFPPLHPNCRSSTRGYIEEYEKDIKRRGRDVDTGKNEVFGNITYKEWLQNQTDKYGEKKINVERKKIVNKSSDKKQFEKYKLFYKGKAKIPATFDKWQDLKYNNRREYWQFKSYYVLNRRGWCPLDLGFNLYKKNVNAKGFDDWQAVGFSPAKKESHLKHLKEYGLEEKDWEIYQNKAKQLLNNGTSYEHFIDRDGDRFVYDKINNDFACAYQNGITRTFFKPTKKEIYWEKQVQKYGKKD